MRGLCIGDGHLDNTFMGRKILRIESQENFKLAAVKAIELNVDAVFYLGDIYDDKEPGPDSTECLSESIRLLEEAGIPVFAICGNHDKYSTYYDSSPGRTIFKNNINYSDDKLLKIKIDDVNIYMLPYLDISLDEYREIFDDIAFQASKTKNNVFMSHFALKEALELSFLDALSVDDLPTRHLDFAILGDIHKPWIYEVNDCTVCYTGSTYPTSVTDMFNHSHCCLLFDTEKKEIEKVDLPMRKWVEVNIAEDIDDVDTETIAVLRYNSLRKALQDKNPFHLHYLPHSKKSNKGTTVNNIKKSLIDINEITNEVISNISDTTEREIMIEILANMSDKESKESLKNNFKNILEKIIK